MSKKNELTPNMEKTLEFIKEHGEGPITASEMKDKGFKANGGTLKALVDRGHLVADKVVIEVVKKREVNAYSLADENENESE